MGPPLFHKMHVHCVYSLKKQSELSGTGNIIYLLQYIDNRECLKHSWSVISYTLHHIDYVCEISSLKQILRQSLKNILIKTQPFLNRDLKQVLLLD